MTNNNLTADSTNISSIQLNLFDEYAEEPDFDEVLNRKIRAYTNLDLENGVVLTSPIFNQNYSKFRTFLVLRHCQN